MKSGPGWGSKMEGRRDVLEPRQSEEGMPGIDGCTVPMKGKEAGKGSFRWP